MDVCEMGSCMDILRRSPEKGFSEDVILSILFPVLQGLKYLHKKQIVHRDIKVGFSSVFERSNCFCI